jgi:hypothetical protein
VSGLKPGPIPKAKAEAGLLARRSAGTRMRRGGGELAGCSGVRLALEEFGQGRAGCGVFDDRERLYVHELCPEGGDLVHGCGGF